MALHLFACAAARVSIDNIRQPFLVVSNNTVLGRSYAVSITAARVGLTQDQSASEVWACFPLRRGRAPGIAAGRAPMPRSY